MTPAINLLKKNKCDFKIHKYDHDPLCTNYGKEVVDKLNLNEKQVFKTLLVEIDSKELVVAIIPVSNQLNLKAVANTFSCKKAQMADKQEAQKVTGYLLGGISPFGQKKRLKMVLDSSAKAFDTIFVSGGKRGLDIEVKVEDFFEILTPKCTSILI
ncbi:Cys-tRNA(Pro) deacylase [Halarcobacter mediterraneus]|uniref:Cys-tRNA(Pro)/Cys-tRNA(Cys) deacylase n=1 Tax=Halarcobacter mediterraneus TaxID=2023153 RepID=A0A4Q1AUD8_9BACT|nr:Cys-tRNA(Pro) deacylase [Halarcobacter mediterraneus]RXK12160.1 Cys-tRNA(Pro) deacylase [Halarcobacter mediterraneus]